MHDQPPQIVGDCCVTVLHGSPSGGSGSQPHPKRRRHDECNQQQCGCATNGAVGSIAVEKYTTPNNRRQHIRLESDILAEMCSEKYTGAAAGCCVCWWMELEADSVGICFALHVHRWLASTLPYRTTAFCTMNSLVNTLTLSRRKLSNSK